MRGSIGRLASSSNHCTKQAFISCSPFSTFSGGGRGRGRGGDPFPDSPISQFNPQQPPPPPPRRPIGEQDVDAPIGTGFPPGFGHGRGKPIGSNPPPYRPSFSSPTVPPPEVSPPIGRGGFTQPAPTSPHPGVNNRSTGRGQGTRKPDNFSPPQDSPSQSGQPIKPIFFRREDTPDEPDVPKQWPMQKPSRFTNLDRNPEDVAAPLNLHPGISGLGRGQPMKVTGADEMPAEVNRHVRPRQDRVPLPREEVSQDKTFESRPKLSREEAAKKAIEVLSRDSGGRVGVGGRGGGDFSGRGGRGGRGVRGGRGRGRSGGRGRGRGSRDSDAEDDASELYLGPDADGEKFAQSLGPKQMEELTQAFEEMSYRVLPSPVQDAYLDAQHTNNMIEYEPEYLVNFDNPDIDEKPPIPLRDALEKMKPFLMAYEGIKSQEEWEEIIDELMGRVPQMKELMDYYCGPNRVTAKQQQQELERVAKTIPENVPSSVKQFTDRAVLSLQSNPGWGWDKKCQFMDKLALEVSQQYK